MNYLEYVDLNISNAIARTVELIDISSHSYNSSGVRKVQLILKKYLENIGFKVRLIDSKEFGPHLLADNGVSGKGVLLVGHSDSAHKEEAGFLETKIDGDRVIGPAGYDMKAGVMMSIFALEALSTCTDVLTKVPIRIMIIGDEEIGMNDSYSLHEVEANNSKLALVFESGRPGSMLITTRKGIAIFKILAKGKGAHSGNDFWKGSNAVVALSEVVSNISKLSSIEDDITLNVGMFNGGFSPTIVAEFAEVKFDIRFPSIEKYQNLYSKLEVELERFSNSGISFEIMRETFIPPMQVLPETTALADSYIKALATIGEKGSVNLEAVGGASSASILAYLGLPTIDALGPYGQGAHTNTEWFSIDSFKQKTKALATWFVQEA